MVYCYDSLDSHVDSGELLLQQDEALTKYLSVRKVVALIVVQRKTQSALILPKVISHEIWVFGQVYCLQRQAPQALPSIDGLKYHTTSASRTVVR